MDGSSRLIYYLIKRARHRWWTASGRSQLTSVGEEEGGADRAGPQPHPRTGLHPGLWDRTHLPPSFAFLCCAQCHLERISLRSVTHTGDCAPFCQALLPRFPNLWLSLSSSCTRHPITVAAILHTLPVGQSSDFPGCRLRPAPLPPNTTPPRPNSALLTGPPRAPPPGLPFAASCFHSQVQGTLASIQMHQSSRRLCHPRLMPFLTLCLISDSGQGIWCPLTSFSIWGRIKMESCHHTWRPSAPGSSRGLL